MSLLEIRNLDAYYGDFQALFGFDFELDEHETVAAIGANGRRQDDAAAGDHRDGRGDQ